VRVTAIPSPTNERANSSSTRLAKARTWLARYGLLLALVILCSLLSLATPSFLTLANWVIVIRQISINAILAVGVTYVLLTGGVDLSLGSVVALTGVTAACWAHPDQYPAFLPVLAGVFAGMLCGMVNGFIVVKGRVAPFIATLGMMIVARGLALVISGGKPVSNLSRQFTRIGGGDMLGIPIPIIILFAVALASWTLLRNTRLGRYVYAVGGNENAARASAVTMQ